MAIRAGIGPGEPEELLGQRSLVCFFSATATAGKIDAERWISDMALEWREGVAPGDGMA